MPYTPSPDGWLILHSIFSALCLVDCHCHKVMCRVFHCNLMPALKKISAFREIITVREITVQNMHCSFQEPALCVPLCPSSVCPLCVPVSSHASLIQANTHQSSSGTPVSLTLQARVGTLCTLCPCIPPFCVHFLSTIAVLLLYPDLRVLDIVGVTPRSF
jgi:hypothetical protein